MNAFLKSEIADGQVVVRKFQTGDEPAFERLNRTWIEKYFRLEDKDRTTLTNPGKYIVESGGQIFLAVHGIEVVGCVAIVAIDNGTYEIVKMAVDDSFQRRGVGRVLLNSAISWARDHGARRLWLETNHILTSAIRLYESCGFKHLPLEKCVPSQYQRSDVQMELWLDNFDFQVGKPSFENLSGQNPAQQSPAFAFQTSVESRHRLPKRKW